MLGFNESISPTDALNPLLGAANVDFLRVTVSWSAVERNRGFYDWSATDRLVLAMRSAGVRPLLVAHGAPCWAAIVCDPTSAAPAPPRYGDYAEFVAALAARYRDAVAIQIWNEPNISKFWSPVPSAAAYAALLRAVGSEGDLPVPIVFGAPSPVTLASANKRGGRIAFEPFLRAVFGAFRDAPPVDAVALHPYGFAHAGNQLAASLDLFDQGAAVLHELVPQLPIWVTEVGFTTAGPHAISKASQARSLVAVVQALVKRGVPLITLHRFFDDADPPYIFEAGMGIVAADRRTPKPAYCAVAALGGAPPALCGL